MQRKLIKIKTIGAILPHRNRIISHQIRSCIDKGSLANYLLKIWPDEDGDARVSVVLKQLPKGDQPLPSNTSLSL